MTRSAAATRGRSTVICTRDRGIGASAGRRKEEAQHPHQAGRGTGLARAALRLMLVSLLAQPGAGCGGAGAGVAGTLSKPSGRRPAARTLSKPSGRRPATRTPGALFADVQAVPAGVADPGGTRIYIGDGEGVKAVAVASGEVLWSTDAAIRPLIASEGRVVAMAGRVPGSPALHSLVSLDPLDGRVIATSPLPIPGRWYPRRPARLEGRRFVLAWGERPPVVRRMCSGMYRPPPKRPPFTPRSGVATVDLASGAVDIGEGEKDEAPPSGVTGDLVPLSRGGSPIVWRTDAGFAAVMPGDGPGALVLRTWDATGGHGTSHPLSAPPEGGALYVLSYGAHVALRRMDSPSGPDQVTIHGLDDGRRIAALPPKTLCAGPALVGDRILCTVHGAAALPKATKPVARPRWGTILTPRAVVAYDRASGDRVWVRPLTPSSRYVCPPLP